MTKRRKRSTFRNRGRKPFESWSSLGLDLRGMAEMGAFFAHGMEERQEQTKARLLADMLIGRKRFFA